MTESLFLRRLARVAAYAVAMWLWMPVAFAQNATQAAPGASASKAAPTAVAAQPLTPGAASQPPAGAASAPMTLIPPVVTTTAPATQPNMADYIVAVVNQELVTNGELQLRLARIRDDAARARQTLPPTAELRKQVLDALIDERVQVTNARETGPKIDEAELDRAVSNVALQNQMTLAQLRTRLAQQGIAFTTFRNNVKDQMLMERVREHEVNARIRISDAEIDAALEKERASAGKAMQLNIAQILVTVPDGATPELVAQRRARAEAALARVKAGESFEAVSKEISEDGNKDKGGVRAVAQRRRSVAHVAAQRRGFSRLETRGTSARGWHLRVANSCAPYSVARFAAAFGPSGDRPAGRFQAPDPGGFEII
jgi:hypothetical protein